MPTSYVMLDRASTLCHRRVTLNFYKSLMLPDFERAARIGEFYGNPQSKQFAELLTDLEEDKFARAVVLGALLEAER